MADADFTENIEKLPEFDSHRLVSFLSDERSGLRGFIAIHRGGLKTPAFGATRIWHYTSEKEALIDALKLSKTMSYKSAMAGLKYGGAKAVIIADFKKSWQRNMVIKKYAQKVNYLGGHFITGADVGLSEKDVRLMREVSPYIVGLKLDPVKFTVLGIFFAISVCLKEVFGKEEIAGRSFAIQGLGKVGFGLLEMLSPKGAKIFVSDIDKKKIKMAKTNFPDIVVVNPLEIERQAVDVFSPCALSNCLNQKNISGFACKIITGGANCQLESRQIGEILYKLGILYAPDYIVNAGGLISVVDEFENNNYHQGRIISRIKNIKKTLRQVFSLSRRKKQATNIIADEIAEKILNKFE
jgi:leucine dehydrogenase